MVREDVVQFAEIKDEDDQPCENIMAITDWVKKTLSDLYLDQAISLKAINVSAYGASFVNIGKNSELITPLYNYLRPYPENSMVTEDLLAV